MIAYTVYLDGLRDRNLLNFAERKLALKKIIEWDHPSSRKKSSVDKGN